MTGTVPVEVLLGDGLLVVGGCTAVFRRYRRDNVARGRLAGVVRNRLAVAAGVLVAAVLLAVSVADGRLRTGLAAVVMLVGAVVGAAVVGAAVAAVVDAACRASRRRMGPAGRR